MSKDIQAIYFDLDDTLCAYWAASRKALRQTFEEAHLPVSADDAMDAWRAVFATFSEEVRRDPWYRHYLESGEPTRTEHLRRTLERIAPDHAHKAEPMSRRYAELRLQYLELFPDAKPVLDALRGKYRLGLITNGPADVQRSEIETLGIEGYFDHILIEGEMQIGKPAKEVFEKASSKWNCEPSQMLFVGNSFDHDVLGAKSAGWQALWMNKEGAPVPDDAPFQPDGIIQDLCGVLDYLGIERSSLSTR
ncbi:MAG: haloacid dehalogenase [Fimbriimonadales bacterium]|nr:MAG: haloacid dehalogenase [Fimbriimonadales bacterium]